MFVLRKDEEEWWFARPRMEERAPSIPVPYTCMQVVSEGGREGDRERERESVCGVSEEERDGGREEGRNE